MKFLNNINLTLNEIQNVKLHNLASAPTGYEGLIYYDTALKRTGVYMNSTQKYFATYDLIAAASGIASLNASSKVVQDPASAATTSGGAAGVIPVTPAGGRLDGSFIPLLNNIPAPTGSVSLNSQAITNLEEPTNPQDAATKNYVDSAVQGLDTKASVKVASIGANITKTNTQTIDTVPLIVGDRVLLKDQTAPAENGIWVVAAGAWTRATDADSWSELVAAYVFVEQGATYADTGWVCTANAGGTLNTTAVNWAQFSAAGTVTAANVGAGTGTIFRDKTGNSINLKSIAAGSTKLSITNNTDTISLDVNEANLVFANMTSSGTLAVAKGGTGTTTSTGTGSVVLSNSPTLVTPVLGVATGTSFNSITGLASVDPLAPAVTAAVGVSTLTARQDHVHPTNFSVTATDIKMNGTQSLGTNVTFPRSDHVHPSDTTKANLVSPAFTTPSLGVATATSINKVTITAPATGATLTLAEGSTLATVGAYTLTLTTTGATNVTFPTSGTLLSSATAVTVGQGGTGATTAAGAKTNLGFMTRYSADIGNGSLTTLPVTHGLGTLDVHITVYEKAGNAIVYPDITLTDTNTASIVFSVAPTSNQYRVVVIG